MKTQFQLRLATTRDLPFLQRMLFEAAYWRPNMPRPTVEAGLANPEIGKILTGWGRDGDVAVIAYDAKTDFGAAWLRFWTESNRSYGFVNESVPEFGIGVASEHRRKGIGRALIRELVRVAALRNIKEISLSVEEDNHSRKLYRSEGFRAVGRIDNADTMLLQLQDCDDPSEP